MGRSDAGHFDHRVRLGRTDVQAPSALDAFLLIDNINGSLAVHLYQGIGRTVLLADPAADTGLGLDVIGNEFSTGAGRAALIPDVGLVLMSEMPDRAEHRIGSPTAQVKRSTPASVFLTVPALAVTCFVGAPLAMHLSNRWPAPYWFAIGVHGLAISALIGPTSRNVLWGAGLGLGAAGATSFAEIAYHICGLEWAYTAPWSVLLKMPPFLTLCAWFPLTRERSGITASRALLASCVYATSYVVLMFFGPFVCTIGLRPSGSFMHGNYDDFGYRLGMYALGVSLLGVLFAKQLYVRRDCEPTHE